MLDRQNLKDMVAMTSLNKMLAESHFSICTIDKVAKLLGIDPKGEAYLILSPLHCMDYAEMPQELRDEIPNLIRECLGVQPAFQFTTMRQEVIDVSPTEKPGMLRRLIAIAQ